MARTAAERSDPAATVHDAAVPHPGHPHHRWDLFMVAAAIASLGLVAWVELNDLDWPHPTFRKCALVDLVFVASPFDCGAPLRSDSFGATIGTTFLVSFQCT
jgi:hypothetical protein